jgi:hypothetical protein
MEVFELIPANTLEFTGGGSGAGWVVLLIILVVGVAIWYVTRNNRS